MAAELLSTIRSEIDARLSELRPSVSEYERLLSATDALVVKIDDEPLPQAIAPRAARKPARRGGRPRGDSAATAPPARERAPRRSPARPKREPASRGAVGQAIVAALEHGSHTVAELVVVTAIPALEIRDGLRRLLREAAIVKTSREGKAAYTLPSAGA